MTLEEKWFSISTILNLANNSSSENEYQKQIANIFVDYLDWPKDLVIREYPIKMGSTKKSDIVLTSPEHTPMVAIEVKKLDSASDGIEQLGSYMDRCNPRLEIGMVFKDKIYLFIDKNTGRDLHDPTDALMTVNFDKEDENGIKFVELFDFKTFSIDSIQNYYEARNRELKARREREATVNNIIQILLNDDSQTIIKESIAHYLDKHGFPKPEFKDIIAEALSNIDITVKRTKPDSP